MLRLLSGCFPERELKLATPGGFEPPISTVTGWHVRPLHHGAIAENMLSECSKKKSVMSNIREADLRHTGE